MSFLNSDYDFFFSLSLCHFFLQVFSPNLWLDFLFSYQYFIEQKVLILTESNLPIFSFTDCAVGVICEKILPHPRSPRFSPRSFIVSHFPFRSMTHLELIFVKSVRPVSRFLFIWHVEVQLFQYYHLWKIQSSLQWISFALFSKIGWHYLFGSILRFSFCSIDSFFKKT